jgi:hypothetical protein
MKAVSVQRDEKSAKAKAAELARQFQGRFAKAMAIFEAGVADVLSYLHYPQPHWVRISSTNPLERQTLEIRRRTRVVGIFPHAGACLRLIGMLLVERHEDWLTDEKAHLVFDDAPAEEPAARIVSMAVGQWGTEHGCLRGRCPRAPGIYRVVARVVAERKRRCRLRHSGP